MTSVTRASAALLQADCAWYGVPTGQFLMRAEADVAEEEALRRRQSGQREDRERREGAKVVRMPQEHGHEADRDSRALDGLDDPRLLGRVAAFTHDQCTS